ncbi:hypothetical protein A4A49_08342 [Nicotiana attenuata]|uniref:Uncharacterized protein n=1 Tax=Nicotiana attenuata TaxID=49451 RepID=A0A1J6ICY1_NICAT|nr:hypothetical protein A4A49_08342 [Nicotiana attenuata]
MISFREVEKIVIKMTLFCCQRSVKFFAGLFHCPSDKVDGFGFLGVLPIGYKDCGHQTTNYWSTKTEVCMLVEVFPFSLEVSATHMLSFRTCQLCVQVLLFLSLNSHHSYCASSSLWC